MDAAALDRALSRISHQILEKNGDLGNIGVVGMQTRGVPLAQRHQHGHVLRQGRGREMIVHRVGAFEQLRQRSKDEGWFVLEQVGGSN